MGDAMVLGMLSICWLSSTSRLVGISMKTAIAPPRSATPFTLSLNAPPSLTVWVKCGENSGRSAEIFLSVRRLWRNAGIGTQRPVWAAG